MAPLHYFNFRKVLLLYLLLFLFSSILVCSYPDAQPLSNKSLGTRRMLELQKDDQPIKKTTTTFSTKNQTKPTTSSSKNRTKLIKASSTSSAKNQTKLIKLTSDSTKNKTNKLIKSTKDSIKETPTIKTQLKKLNSTSKPTNSTKPSSNLTKKSTDLIKPSSPKNKTTKPTATKQSQTQLDKKLMSELKKSKNQEEKQPTNEKKPNHPPPKTQKPKQPSWIDQEDEEDLVSEFRDLTSKFQETLLPDLHRISTTSKVYLNRANKQITKGFKPIVGTKYAPTIASIVSFAFILIPLILVSLIFNRIKAYFSLQKLLIFIQIYLSIYFSILCLSSLVTGLEPLRFFYATSESTYVCVQLLQTLGYVLYLLLLLMYLVLVFSSDSGPGSKMLGLGQTIVGFAVGLHYYVKVFHRVVLHQPPKTNWKVHGIYATCFLVICVLARADRRKKAYLVDGGEEGKNS